MLIWIQCGNGTFCCCCCLSQTLMDEMQTFEDKVKEVEEMGSKVNQSAEVKIFIERWTVIRTQVTTKHTVRISSDDILGLFSLFSPTNTLVFFWDCVQVQWFYSLISLFMPFFTHLLQIILCHCLSFKHKSAHTRVKFNTKSWGFPLPLNSVCFQ